MEFGWFSPCAPKNSYIDYIGPIGVFPLESESLGAGSQLLPAWSLWTPTPLGGQRGRRGRLVRPAGGELLRRVGALSAGPVAVAEVERLQEKEAESLLFLLQLGLESRLWVEMGTGRNSGHTGCTRQDRTRPGRVDCFSFASCRGVVGCGI